MKILLLSMAFMTAFIQINGQTQYLQSVKETQELSKKIVKLFEEKEISKAFKELTVYWPIDQNEIDAIEDKSIKYLNMIDDRFGKLNGSLKVKNEHISDIAYRETYIIRYEFSAIRLIFTYYKNDNGWIVNAFKWDDSFEEEFEKN